MLGPFLAEDSELVSFRQSEKVATQPLIGAATIQTGQKNTPVSQGRSLPYSKHTCWWARAFLNNTVYFPRGWPETYDMNTSEPKPELESMPPGGRPPYRSSSSWQWSGPASHNSLPASKWAAPAASGHAQSLSRPPKQTPMVPFRESQPLHSKR